MSDKVEQVKPKTNKKVSNTKDSQPKTKPFTAYKAVVNVPLLNVRENGDFSATILKTIDENTIINIYEVIGDWGKISKTTEEWVNLTYVQKK